MDAPSDHSAAPPLADAGLRCPKCEYNLTGLAEDRCPECGEAFDREQLQSGTEPIPGWGSASSPFIGFSAACLMTWFTPVTFGRRFPDVHDRKSLGYYKSACLAVGFFSLLLFTLALLGMPRTRDYEAVEFLIGVLCGVMTCEWIAQFMLLLCFGEAGWQGPLDVWTGLAGLYRSFLVLDAIVLICAEAFCPYGLMLLFLAIVLWWSASLAIAAASRSNSWNLVPIAMILLWICAGTGIFVGVAGGKLLGGAVVEAIERTFH